jgi:hypothetical protein
MIFLLNRGFLYEIVEMRGDKCRCKIKKNTKVAWLTKDSKHKSIYQMDD